MRQDAFVGNGDIAVAARGPSGSLAGAELGMQGIAYGAGPCLGGLEFSNGSWVTVR